MKKNKYKWVLIVTILAFIISLLMSLLVTTLFENVTLVLAIIITFVFIVLGIIFDIIGVSVTIGDEVVFHSMSSRRVRGGRMGVYLIKNNDKVASICCDVIGDICGIISGSAGVTIIALLVNKTSWNILGISLIVTALISALTIGGKALGKIVAINKSTEIITIVAKMLSIFSKNT